MRHISVLRNLDGLNLRATQVSNSGLAYLAGLPWLTSLNLDQTLVTSQGLPTILGLEWLKYLRLPAEVSGSIELRQFQQQVPRCNIYCGETFYDILAL